MVHLNENRVFCVMTIIIIYGCSLKANPPRSNTNKNYLHPFANPAKPLPVTAR